MNPRQGVIIAMFLSMAVYLLANAQASVIINRTNQLKQTPKTLAPSGATVTSPRNVGGGGTSGSGSGGAGGGF